MSFCVFHALCLSVRVCVCVYEPLCFSCFVFVSACVCASLLHSLSALHRVSFGFTYKQQVILNSLEH